MAGFFWATSTPGQSYEGAITAPDDVGMPARLEADVRNLSEQPRNLDHSSSIISSLAYLSGALEEMGYAVERQEVLAPAENLIVTIPSAAPNSPILIIGAHYDTVQVSPGADDNASGVAALLEIARRLKKRGSGPTEVQLVFYANEEPPYFQTGAMGSHVHAMSLLEPDRVAGMISLETMGYFSNKPGSQNYPFPLSVRYPSTGNFIAFVGDTSSRDFLRETIGQFRKNARIPSVGGTAPSIIQGIDWSDHWAYSRLGIPAFMVTDTAVFRNPNYHRISDTPETLDYARLALVVEGLEATITDRFIEKP
ncbi:M20/M25/M40 family metallo-hydrolase [Erythrobacter sp. THAF29]|uniref:M20/M25/M40 family metallo-hydrolase n=1 Tax=Erythrobacter sp. THAF29 TaxID=2587851 RepID=UPI001562B770|nr:M20/M25/M40 family metallo-hydrolase [Erythrobacter sp. THAF29]